MEAVLVNHLGLILMAVARLERRRAMLLAKGRSVLISFVYRRGNIRMRSWTGAQLQAPVHSSGLSRRS